MTQTNVNAFSVENCQLSKTMLLLYIYTCICRANAIHSPNKEDQKNIYTGIYICASFGQLGVMRVNSRTLGHKGDHSDHSISIKDTRCQVMART